MAHRGAELHSLETRKTAEVVPLQSAVLCLDCEFVSGSRCDVCPVCGGHSLLGLAGVIGGTLVEYSQRSGGDQPVFDLQITIELRGLEGQGLSAAIERITNLVAPNLVEGAATCHIHVEPVTEKTKQKRAAAA